MRGISYPKGSKLAAFEQKYLDAMSSGVDKQKINHFLQSAPQYKGSYLTFDTLALLPLADLILYEKPLSSIANKNIKKHKKTIDGLQIITYTNTFLDLFKYSLKQPQLSSVFRQENSLNLKTCHYCGIDYINGFSDFGDYKGPVDFLNNADYEDLKFVPEIGHETALNIIAYRNNVKIKEIEDIKLNVLQKKNLLDFKFKNNYDHFTLDHVIPQKPYGFFSLCLYNLVPSCYGCNTKFKNSKDFKINKSLLKISPTSSIYSMSKDFKFKVLYSGNLKDITKSTDFVLRLDYLKNFNEIYNYDKIFKLTGRYIAHKDELLELIKKKVKNPNCDIQSKAKLLKISPEEYKKLIYGKEIFKKESTSPMHKFKRDVAIHIKII